MGPVPELLEVEYYRRLAEEALERRVLSADVPDPHCLGPPLTIDGLRRAVVGRQLAGTRRRGKLLLLDFAEATDKKGGDERVETTLGLRFGMTGTLLLDERPGVERLRHAPEPSTERWVRLRLGLGPGPGSRRARGGRRIPTTGHLALCDPRRFGRVLLAPDEDELGPDAWDVTRAELAAALRPGRSGSSAAVKARLLDQGRLAGLGNLLVDEILWRAAIAPGRPGGEVVGEDLARLRRSIRATLRQLLRRGGSHLGDMTPERRLGGRCPADGAALSRSVVGGRTTWWCPAHQR